MSSATRRSSVSPFRSRKTHPPPRDAPSPSMSSSSSSATFSKQPASRLATTPGKAKENVTVTVRLRPLSAREISKGDEVAWYADGDYTVRNEFNADIGYGFVIIAEIVALLAAGTVHRVCITIYNLFSFFCWLLYEVNNLSGMANLKLNIN